MGNKPSRGVKQKPEDSLPPLPTVDPLHQQLLQVASALHSGNKNPVPLYQISEIINSFLPPTRNLLDSSEILYQFPSAENELRITAIKVGEITNSKPILWRVISKPNSKQTIHSGYHKSREKKQFHVKLIFDGTKFFNLEFPPVPNTNSFHYKPNSMEFDIFVETEGDQRTWSKSYNEVLADLVVMKPRASPPPQEAASTTTNMSSSASASPSSSSREDELVQMISMKNNSLIGDACWYSETIPASCLLQYIGARLCSIDFSNVHHMLEIPKVLITVTVFPFSVIRMRDRCWLFSCISWLELSEPITVLMDGDRYLSTRITCTDTSCVFFAIVEEPEVQLLSLQVDKQQGSANTVNLTISKPMDRLQYIRRHVPVLPIIPQDLKVAPPKSLGAITFSNQGQLPVVSMKLPRFFQQYCFVKLITNFTVEPRDTLVMRDSYLETHVHKVDFLKVNFRKLSKVMPSELSLSLKRDGLQGQDPEVLCFFHVENLTEEALNQESTRGPKKRTRGINLGQMLLDQFSFFVWKNRNHHVTAKKLNELREYVVRNVSSNASFTKCVFEITMEICKHSQLDDIPDVTTTMTMLLDLEKMIATISEKQLLNIELEFGLRSADALSCLQSLLYDAATKSSQFHDILLCFESTTICEAETS